MYFFISCPFKKSDTMKNILGNESKLGDTAHVGILYLNGIK